MKIGAGMEREEYATLVTKAIINSAPLQTVPCVVLFAHLMISLYGEKRRDGEGMRAGVHG